ncbi:type II pantothenate kinase [Bacillus spongiae]|uniref:Type II pantothenate kinase n=1 Tax=Bacillus spongiae TaxID=2683610 RepID=A0ABU8HC25_9BACI
MRTIGIDAGGTLAKITYIEKGRFQYKWFLMNQIEKWLPWLQFTAGEAKFHVTGGKATKLMNRLDNVLSVPEFTAMAEGTRVLLREEGRKLDRFILVSIGTGTSIYLVDPKNEERVAGTALGGGSLLGLGKLLTNAQSFQEIMDLAAKGKRQQVDLVVQDLYDDTVPPIPGDLTASYFEKAHHLDMKKEDLAAALINMIGELIISLAFEAAKQHQLQSIVFVGSTLQQNKLLKEVLSRFEKMLHYEAIFIEKGAFVGARGAYHFHTT